LELKLKISIDLTVQTKMGETWEQFKFKTFTMHMPIRLHENRYKIKQHNAKTSRIPNETKEKKSG